jgi:osmotically-inducible protein OsmY
MARLLVVATLGVIIPAFTGCHAETGNQDRDRPLRAEAVTEQHTSAVSRNPEDVAIGRDLKLAIDGDASLRGRQIDFVVVNGDVSVTGTVHSEEERTRINDLAMAIGGVKSVANALRVRE